MTGALHLPEAVRESKPSTRLVYVALNAHGPLTLQEIEALTGVARRTGQVAISELEECGLVDEEPHPEDGRRRLFDVDPPRPSPNRTKAASNSPPKP